MTNRRYRVAHLITRLELGGAQQNTLFCAEHHDRRHFEVDLVAGAGGILDDDARRIPDAHVELLDCLKHPIAPASDVRAVLALGRYFRRRQVELVHTHSSKAGILGRTAAWLAGVPHVVHTAHGWSFNDTQPAALRRAYVALERAAARVTDRLLVVSESQIQQGLALGIGRPEQYRVLRSGIEVDGYRHAPHARADVREALGYGAEHVVVGSIACLKAQKAPLDFVRVAAAAARTDGRLRFFIAGDGALRPQVEALAHELGVSDRLQLLGWRSDVVDLLHAMDVFLLTSLFEGLPRAVLQAMAAGVPVVASAVDGTPEVVESGVSGMLFPPGDVERAREALLTVVADPELRSRVVAAARERLDASFDIRQMVLDLDRLYLSLLREESRDDSAGRRVAHVG